MSRPPAWDHPDSSKAPPSQRHFSQIWTKTRIDNKPLREIVNPSFGPAGAGGPNPGSTISPYGKLWIQVLARADARTTHSEPLPGVELRCYGSCGSRGGSAVELLAGIRRLATEACTQRESVDLCLELIRPIVSQRLSLAMSGAIDTVTEGCHSTVNPSLQLNVETKA